MEPFQTLLTGSPKTLNAKKRVDTNQRSFVPVEIPGNYSGLALGTNLVIEVVNPNLCPRPSFRGNCH